MVDEEDPNQQSDDSDPEPYGFNSQRQRKNRKIWPLLAAGFALVAILLVGVIIGSRNNISGGAQAGPTGDSVNPEAGGTRAAAPTSTSTLAIPGLEGVNESGMQVKAQDFQNSLNAYKIPYSDFLNEYSLGLSVCNEFRTGASLNDIIASAYAPNSSTWTFGDAAHFTGIAVRVFCPQFKNAP